MSIKEFLFTKKYGSLFYRFHYFFNYKIPFISKGWNTYHNPWYYWWKVRKYFKRPKAHFAFLKNYWTYGLPIRRNYYNPIIDIGFHALGWKDKYNSPRHEYDPMINIVFFRKWHLFWVFNWVEKDNKESYTKSMATWEAILDTLYYNSTLEQAIKDNVWSSGFNEDKKYITIDSNLKYGHSK